jgi:predicted ATPase/DNA-binding SARP family transcriptional activator
MAQLAMSLLGSLEVRLAGAPASGFESNKVRALLAYLAIEADRAHHRQVLAGLLWPDWPDRTARTYLRNALSNLRRIIGDHEASPPFLIITPRTLQFNRASDYWLDVAAFEEKVGMAPAAASAPQPSEDAVALYRGDFLEGFSLKDSPAFEDWSLMIRERLQRQVLTALSQLARYYERRGEYARATDYAWRQAELAPWQEEAHQQLMRILALGGQRSAALAQYETCCGLLREELGVDPALETTHLYEQIREGELGKQADKETKPHNLPASLTPLIGRETELAEISDHLQDPDCRLLTLVGPGGSGKTRLALEAATNLISDTQTDRFRHRLFFISLAPLQSVETIVPTIAQALGFSFHSPDDPLQELLDYLRWKSLLLVLDNFEHLLDGVGLVAEILKRAPAVKILVTSRARLNMQGETLFPVAGLDYPALEVHAVYALSDALSAAPSHEDRNRKLQDVAEYGAVRLFLHRARQVEPEFEPTTDDLRHITHICHLVQGMPLGILLAAAWMQMLTPADIVTQLSEQSLDFLEMDWCDVPTRHRSMRAVFDSSWKILTGREREVFQGLSVFRGGFTYQAAQQVVGASLRELMALANKTLLHRTPSRRYDLHELVRQYAGEKLAHSLDGGVAIWDRYSAYYATALQEWAAALKGSGQQAVLAEIEADLQNAQAAWNWAVERGHVEHCAQAIEGLGRFYEWRARYREGEKACRLAANKFSATSRQAAVDCLADTEQQRSGDELRTLVKILTWQSVFSKLLGQTGLAGQLLERSWALLERPELADQDIRSEQAVVLREMGEITQLSGDREEAGRLYAQSLALYRALGDRRMTADLLTALGKNLGLLARYGEARQLLEEGLAMRRSMDDVRGIADSLMELSGVASEEGRLQEAQRSVRESIAICQKIGDWTGAADGLHSLGARLVHSGRFNEAHRLLTESVAIYNEQGRQIHLARATGDLGWAKVNLGLYEQARLQDQRALALFKETGNRRGIGLKLLGLGQIELAEESYAEARRLIVESIAIFRGVQQLNELGLALAELGHTDLRLGRVSQAQQNLCEALRVSAKTGALPSTIISIAVIALLLAHQEEPERAVELYALASRHPYVGNSRYWEDTAGRHIATMAAALPPEAFESAKERGRTRDLKATVAELLVELER